MHHLIEENDAGTNSKEWISAHSEASYIKFLVDETIETLIGLRTQLNSSLIHYNSKNIQPAIENCDSAGNLLRNVKRKMVMDESSLKPTVAGGEDE